VFAAISSALDSNGFAGSPGTVQKRHASLPVSASKATTDPRTLVSDPLYPMNTLSLPACGAPVIPGCVPSHTVDSPTCFPDEASIATSRQSPVPTYTLPFHTATPRFVRADQELRIRSRRTFGSKVHSTLPDPASTARTRDCGALT